MTIHHGNRSQDMLDSLHSHVRMFETIHLSSAGSPDVKNENDYERQSQLSPLLNSRKRHGSDTTFPALFLPGSNEKFGHYDNNNMDVTQDIPSGFACKRSLSHISNESTQSFATSEQPKPLCSFAQSMRPADQDV